VQRHLEEAFRAAEMVVKSKDPIAVAVGWFGSVIDRGLVEILGGDKGLRVVGAGLDHASLRDVVAEGKAQVVVLDEDSVSTPALPMRLRGLRGDVGLVALAHRPNRAYAKRILAFGVPVCVSIDAPARELVRAVHLAADGRHVFVSMSPRSPQTTAAAVMRSLTRREREVLGLLSKGEKNAETARTHAQHVYRKLGVTSRLELLGIE
jgi:DNA-binding NarL/FixJ family response regulator